MRILILGSSGMLGRYILKELKNVHNVFHNGIKKRKYSLSDTLKLKKLIIESNPQVIINTSGVTNIELCEKNKVKSKKINVVMVKKVFELKKKLKKNFKFIQISTDQLYDSKSKKKGVETAKPIINNEYARQKYSAEEICKKNKSIILRTNFFGKSTIKKKSFSDWAVKAFREKKSFFLVDNVLITPLRMKTISKIISKLLKVKNLRSHGVYNLGSRGGISKKNLALKLASILNIKNKLFKIRKINDICDVKRSENMMMNVSKFERTFSIMLPKIDEEIKSETLNYEKN